VVVHQAIGDEANPRCAFARLAQELDEGGEIAIFMKNSAAAVARVKDVVAITALGRACATRHAMDYRLLRKLWGHSGFFFAAQAATVTVERVFALFPWPTWRTAGGTP
jgi:hypothetical protein